MREFIFLELNSGLIVLFLFSFFSLAMFLSILADLSLRSPCILHTYIWCVGILAWSKRSTWRGQLLLVHLNCVITADAWFSIIYYLNVSSLYYNLQIRSLEALHQLFEQFPRAFMGTLHVPLPNRLYIYFIQLIRFLI